MTHDNGAYVTLLAEAHNGQWPRARLIAETLQVARKQVEAIYEASGEECPVVREIIEALNA